MAVGNGTSLGAVWTAWQHLRIIGEMKGDVGMSYERNLFLLFAGIRYAMPPIGNLTFKDPVPVNKNFNLGRKVDCLEVNPMDERLIGEQDCLFLNVFTPVPYVNKKMPVLIWIQGEALPLGSNRGSMYHPMRLMDHDMIVVTLSYRLGPLGFASLGEKDFSGNYGLKDQKMAIEWVLKNIHLFGGDPGRITLAGEGAGASYTLFHLYGDLAGRVRRGIALSGSRFAPWALPQKNFVRERTYELFYPLGCFDADDFTLDSDCLVYQDHKDIVRAAFNIFQKKTPWIKATTNIFMPVVDGSTIRAHPWKSRLKGNFSLLLGLKKDETVVVKALASKYAWSKNMYWEAFCYDIRDHKVPWKCSKYAISKKLVDEYNLEVNWKNGVLDMTADEWFTFSAMLEALHHEGPLDAFMYDFNIFPSSKKCSKRYRVPFMDVLDPCPPWYKGYDSLVGKFTELIASFVHGRELNLKPYSEDRQLFNITKAIRLPEAFAEIDVNLSKRMKKWTRWYKK